MLQKVTLFGNRAFTEVIKIIYCSVTQSCPTVCKPTDFSFRGILQARTLDGVGCHSLLQGIFPTQGSNPHLLHCRWIVYFWSTRKAQLRLCEVIQEQPQSSMFDVSITGGNLTQEDAHRKMLAGMVMHLQARKHPRCWKRTRSSRRGIDRPPLPGLKRDNPAYTLITGILPPEL